MSDKDRKKKDGHDKGKENEAMHAAVRARHDETAHHQQSPQSDQEDLVHYKRGAENDRTPKPVSPNISQ